MSTENQWMKGIYWVCELPCDSVSSLATRSCSAAVSMETRSMPMDLQADEAFSQFLCQADEINQFTDYQKERMNFLPLWSDDSNIRSLHCGKSNRIRQNKISVPFDCFGVRCWTYFSHKCKAQRNSVRLRLFSLPTSYAFQVPALLHVLLPQRI